MTNSTKTHVFVLMGVAGSGKSAVGSALVPKLSAAFLDGDFLHSRANIAKNVAGIPLNDDDRRGWLTAINDAAYAMQRTNTISIIACSALKKQYRDLLRKGNDNLSFIYLQGQFDVIEARLKARKGHFFKPAMLVTQFETLEEPNNDETDVHLINIDRPLEQVICDTIDWIQTICQ